MKHNLQKLLLVAVMILSSTAVRAQYFNQTAHFIKSNSNWIFGHDASLQFQNGGGRIGHMPGFSAISSASVSSPATGELLFYSDGRKVYNKNHDVMLNGDSISPEEFPKVGSQSVCIVPMIDSPDMYYLFHLEDGDIFTGHVGYNFYYSVIDMTGDNGLGSVVPHRRAILIDSCLSSSVIAVPGNNCDIWLLTHNYPNPSTKTDTPAFHAYHITMSGIDKGPVVSQTGTQIDNPPGPPSGGLNPDPLAYKHIHLAISPDRSQVALGAWDGNFGSLWPDGPLGPISGGAPYDTLYPGHSINIHSAGALACKFDPNTGQVSGALFIRDYGSCGSVCFSPDNSKLYVYAEGPSRVMNIGASIQQYDMTIWDSAIIVRSAQTIAASNTSTLCLKLYNDTIYIGGMSAEHIGRINQPDLPGALCNYQDTAFMLVPTSLFSEGWNGDVVYYDADTIYFRALDTVICQRNYSLTAPTWLGHYTWDDGSTLSTRTISEAGTYWIRGKDGCNPRVDSFVIKGMDMADAAITVDQWELGTTPAGSYVSWQWYYEGVAIPGAMDSVYAVTQNGTFSVVVSDANGCRDTAYYEVNNTSVSSPQGEQQMIVYPNPVVDKVNVSTPVAATVTFYDVTGKMMSSRKLKMPGKMTIDMEGFGPGIYFIRIMDYNGCLLQIEKIIKIR